MIRSLQISLWFSFHDDDYYPVKLSFSHTPKGFRRLYVDKWGKSKRGMSLRRLFSLEGFTMNYKNDEVVVSRIKGVTVEEEREDPSNSKEKIQRIDLRDPSRKGVGRDGVCLRNPFVDTLEWRLRFLLSHPLYLFYHMPLFCFGYLGNKVPKTPDKSWRSLSTIYNMKKWFFSDQTQKHSLYNDITWTNL